MSIHHVKKAVLLLFMLVPAVLWAQSGTVTANYKDKTLKAVLEDIEKQTGYKFVYSLTDINAADHVTASFKSTELKTVLGKVLYPSFWWSVNGKMISLTAQKHPAPDTRIESARPSNKIQVSGVVVDEKGIPVIGAAVHPKNISNYGTSTDLDGNFSISVTRGTVLQVSSIGFITSEHVAEEGKSARIVLKEDNQVLNETIVVGYGVQDKESVVGAISQVGTDALVNSGTTSISNSIAGKLSGVQTYQTSGQPGKNNAKIYIRGMSSWNNDSPLVMVDGIERDFNDLDPNEVETISVLKDASATAVFGAKGANGVILVTTRTGSKGKPKMHLSFDYGIDLPSRIPVHVSSAETARMANIALKNDGSYASQYTDKVISCFEDGSQPLRYTDNDWFKLMLRDFAQTFNANYNVSGGGERARYFVSIGYSDEGSIVKRVSELNGATFNYHRINYRSNLDFDVTRTTKVSVKVGGSTGVTQVPDDVSVTSMFNEMLYADIGSFPAYFPPSALEQIKDWDYPDATGMGLSNNGSTATKNPYTALSAGDYTKTMANHLATDLELVQKLDAFVKGLSFKAKTGLTTEYTRISEQVDYGYASYYIDWKAYDSGEANPWVSSRSSMTVDVNPPLSMHQYNSVASTWMNFYLEAGLNYENRFGRNKITGLALYNQRSVVNAADFPAKNQGLVGRVTYDYAGKYLVEANVGYTGSEQFSPKNRFGFFPSMAVGYVLSKESWWKNAMPWWSKMKLRFSDGLVGTDSSSSKWLYYSVYETTGNGTYKEKKSANDTARWETARKRDLGVEMGWFKDALTMTIDLFDENRTDMLMTPVVTPLVGIGSVDINAGALKKHGYEIETKYRRTSDRGFYREVGGMFSFNENRIVKYADLPYAPEYQKTQGKAYMAQTSGMEVVDDTYFNSIDEIHGYPSSVINWATLMPGRFKYLDYDSNNTISKDDAHTIKGSKAPFYVYSFNFGLGYKGFSFKCLFYGNAGKYSTFSSAYYTEFYQGNLVAHKAQLDYWTPWNKQASHRNLSYFGDGLSNIYLDGQTWRRSDYLNLKEIYLAYKFDGDKLHDALGIRGLSITATANNLCTFTNLVEGDPQRPTLEDSYYPIVKIVKLGIKVDL